METTTGYEPDDGHGSLGGELVRNPVLQTLVAMAAVSVLVWTGQQAGNVEPFVLNAPVTEPWWGPVVSIYAHSSPTHLLSNAVILVLAGGAVSFSTSALRFHAFFLLTGILSGISFVWLTGLLGTPAGGLGASGATFAFVGYVITGNPASSTILGRASSLVVATLSIGVALVMTVMWSAPGSAFFVHFVGAVFGLLAGHFHILRTTGPR